MVIKLLLQFSNIKFSSTSNTAVVTSPLNPSHARGRGQVVRMILDDGVQTLLQVDSGLVFCRVCGRCSYRIRRLCRSISWQLLSYEASSVRPELGCNTYSARWDATIERSRKT